jgi:hypothetical protein
MKIPPADDDVWRWIVIGVVTLSATVALFGGVIWWEFAHPA